MTDSSSESRFRPRPRLEATIVGAGAVLLLALVALPACTVQGLTFEQDDRITFIEPGYREKVTFPVTIRWSVDGFQVTGPDGESRDDAGYFGVMFDVDPQPPGEGLDYFARNDISCRRSEGCPDRGYLEERGVYTTTATHLTVTALPPAPGVELDRGEPDIHDVIVVLLDGEGRRIGESAWWQTFEVIHED